MSINISHIIYYNTLFILYIHKFQIDILWQQKEYIIKGIEKYTVKGV
jgi:hypothetical protein